jgi:hypothetical protein
MRIVLPVQFIAASLASPFESRETERVIGERNVERDIEIAHLGALTWRINGHQRDARRQSSAAEYLHIREVHGARETAFTIVVTFFDGQAIVGDEQLDACPPADDAWSAGQCAR